jgi:chaperonin GroEL (HSP60 family)
MGDRQGMAMEAYASALESIPRTLAENAGIDPVDAIINIRKAKNENYGISVEGNVINMRELGVIEPKKVLETAILTATSCAVMILRIDDVISMKASPQGMPPMMG